MQTTDHADPQGEGYDYWWTWLYPLGYEAKTFGKVHKTKNRFPLSCHWSDPKSFRLPVKLPCRFVNWAFVASKIIDVEFPSYGIMMRLSQATQLSVVVPKGRMPTANNAALHSLCDAWGFDFEAWDPI